MATPTESAYMAHISDTLTSLSERLDEHQAVQNNILTVLNAMLETSQAQSEMLAEILGAASQEAGPSPVAEALEKLVAQVQQHGETLTVLIESVGGLPAAVGEQFAIGFKEWSETAASN